MSYSLVNRNIYFASPVSSHRSNELVPIKERYSNFEDPSNVISRMKISHTEQKKPVSNKWYKEPKIPIQMNSSCLIRMKNNENNAGLENAVKKKSSNQLALNAQSFLKRDRRMSDYVNQKYELTPQGALPFDSSSYIKNVFLQVVSAGDNALVQEQKFRTSANPSGDACQNGTYHRVSALSINDLKSGCNLKYFEEVSFQGNKGVNLEEKCVKEKGEMNDCSKMERTLKPSKEIKCLDYGKKLPESGDGDVFAADYQALIKKQIRKNKKPVVITCLKNSSIKYVNKKK